MKRILRRVILESPYAATETSTIERHTAYARDCLRDSLLRGEAPIASHLLYTQPRVLSDDIPTERDLGIAAGLSWLHVADKMVVYIDLGISSGMLDAIALAMEYRMKIEYRAIWPVARGEVEPSYSSTGEDL